MQDFAYKAVSQTGETIKAKIKADSVENATKLLIERDMYVISIEEDSKGNVNIDSFIEKFHRIKDADRVVFTRQLATLIKAGLPIAGAMRLLVDQMENPNMKAVVREISVSIEGGATLAESLRKFPKVFSKVYISVVEAGEVSGKLEEVLLKQADQEEKTAELNRKIRGALTYPAVILAVVIIVGGIMVSVVLPEIGKIYTELRQEVPFQTQLLLSGADFITKFWYIVLLFFAALIYGIKIYLATDQGRSVWDRVKLNLPGFKTLIRKIYMTRFTSTLSALVNSGVPVLQALEITASAVNNVHLESSIKTVEQRVKSGAPLSQPIGEDEIFLPLVSKMITVGEQTGSIGDSLEKVASYYEQEVDDAIDNLSSLIEPATMVILGLLIAFLVAAVLLPIYGLVNNVG